jgi:hypothetical protein
MTVTATRPGAATRLASLVAGIAGGHLPVRIRAWTAARPGPPTGPSW